MKLKSYLVVLIMACFTTAHTQNVMINGVQGNRLLTWSDFTGEPDTSNHYFANTAWKTMYLYQVKFSDKTASITDFQFTLLLDPKATWLKPGKGSDALLKHEQGHFDVGFLYMQEVIKNIKTVTFSRDSLVKELEAFIAKTHQKYADMNLRYDEETAHSAKTEAQGKWNSYFDKECKR